MSTNVCFFVGTHGDWGGASRILFNIIRSLDRQRFEPIVMLSQAGPIRDELDRRGVEYHVWGRHDFANPVAFLFDVFGCASFFRKRKVKLIHLHHGCIGWRPAELTAARLLRIPVVQHVQQPVSKPSPDLLGASLVLTCSRYLSTVCDTRRVPKKVIYDLVDEERFSRRSSIRAEIGLGSDDIVFAFLGRARRTKGLQMFIELARRIDDPRVRFVIASQRVGAKMHDGYSVEEIEAMVAGNPRIRFIGFREDAENVFASADVIVVPSQVDEPCPAVIIESAICAKPVVATRVGSTPEFVEDGETGFLVDRQDLTAMVDRAREMIARPELRESMGCAAYRLAKERFVTQPREDMHAIYSDLVRP